MDLANLKKSITDMSDADLETLIQQVRKGRRTFTNDGNKVKTKAKRKPKKPTISIEKLSELIEKLSDQVVELEELGAEPEDVKELEAKILELMTEKLKLEKKR